MDKLVVNFIRDEGGASLAEYGILVALIAVVAIVAVQTLGGQINTAFENIVNALTGTGGG